MPSDRPVLRERAKDVVIERILSGEYPPGTRIKEHHLATELGVSQAPIREAIRDLEAMRFVESQPYRGARVREVSRDELAEIYPVRAALEEVAGRAAAVRMTAGQLATLDAELSAMRRAARAGDRDQQLARDARFHELIVEAAGNTTLHEVWTSLRIEARTLVSLLHSDDDLVSIADTHQAIVDALRSGDATAAGTQMRRHIESFGDLLAPDTTPEPAGDGPAANDAGALAPSSDSTFADDGANR